MKTSTAWIELPPINQQVAPSRLLVFLPGNQSSAESFAPVAVAWQLKFPSAVGMIVQPPLGDASWWERHRSRRDAAASCARLVARQIQDQQRLLGLLASQTTVIGFAQGATVALELVRRSTLEEAHEDSGPSTSLCSVVVAYAAQLARPLLAHERVDGSVHLIHGDLDHRVPAIYGHQAYRSLKAAGADVTWDLLADATHTIGQDGVIVGTMRALHSIFRGRSKGRVTTLH